MKLQTKVNLLTELCLQHHIKGFGRMTRTEVWAKLDKIEARTKAAARKKIAEQFGIRTA